MKAAKRSERKDPSSASLAEIPEIDFSKAKVRSNRYAKRIAKEGIVLQVGRGRPQKNAEVGGTRPHSVRFPDAIWRQLTKRAKREGLSVHAALRRAILEWLQRAA